MTIHVTLKRSATMPKRGEKKVLVSGICTCPPSASTLNRRSASASLGTVSDSDIPWKPGLPWQAAVGRHHSRIADAQAGMHEFILRTGRDHTGRRGLGAFLETHQHRGLGTER